VTIADAEREGSLTGHCQGLLRQAEEIQLGNLERYRGDYQQQWINQGQRGVWGVADELSGVFS
jgi:flagellar FliJ protein